MHRRNQLIVIVSALLLVVVLLFQPITGLINASEEPASETSQEAASSVNFSSESQRAKQGLNPSIVQEINELEERLSKTSVGEERLDILQQLAQKWDDVNRHAPQGFIYEEMAAETKAFQDWLRAGNAYREAYASVQDTAIAFPLNSYAIAAYEQALELEPNNLDAMTGLGASYVSGTSNPMAGIALLQEVVKADPNHLEANKSLGLFSMQSRQFDRAIDRFQTVVSLQPDAESYFYLATSYENIGLKQEAIAAFEKSKELAADPTLNQFIDRKIAELSN